ncbi:anti-sigma factor family protein [Cohnella hashimotonis]|uniref:Anti-sigma-W factor RsiW n=1 Tax=Cohnella hashimotonis TaxID=2826895 RepID=A0ABT6TGS0_9BACL|nr:zf-HC2 domain-containing protein [Cohnella hashimotonis]MDI4645505.1 zf-HC2 domain-containing protein [Cohnella hashimotonis]
MTLTCGHVQQQMESYWDLEEGDPQRREIDAHVAGCPSCAAEFHWWEESTALIREVALEESYSVPSQSAQAVNVSVMSRIYAEDGWLLPPARRAYSFTGPFRRRVVTIVACLLALCCSGILLTLYDRMHAGRTQSAGIMEAAGTGEMRGALQIDMPVSRMSDPFVLNSSPAMPGYWIMLSVLGVLAAFLIVNWYSRLKKG